MLNNDDEVVLEPNLIGLQGFVGQKSLGTIDIIFIPPFKILKHKKCVFLNNKIKI